MNKSLDHIATFTLRRADGAEKQIRFDDEPGWVLIGATTDTSGSVTPRITDHDRFDYNKRNRDVWAGRMHLWLAARMKEFSEGNAVKAYYDHPYIAIAGLIAI